MLLFSVSCDMDQTNIPIKLEAESAAKETTDIEDLEITIGLDDTDYHDIDNYYLSITGSYNDDNNILNEVYAVYDFESDTLNKIHSVQATSSYPCGVCDLKNNVVYYSAAEETELGGRTVFLDNVYAYHTDDQSVERLTDHGYFMNRMIPVEDKIYFAGGRRSSAAVEFGWIDLADSNTVVYPEYYAEVGTINVRNIEYSYATGSVYTAWYSLKEQSTLDKEYSERQESGAENNVRELASYYLDRIDINNETISTVEQFSDFHPETFTIDQQADKILMCAPEAEPPLRLRENGETAVFDYPGSAMTAMSPDSESIYYITVSETETNGVPNTELKRYDFDTGVTEDIAQFDFYVNNMVLLLK